MKSILIIRMSASVLVSACLMLPQLALATGGWAAVAYNPATTRWGEAHGYDVLADAKNAALNACGAGCAIAGWVHNGFIALVTGDAGWAVSDGRSSAAAATQLANQLCSSVTTNCDWHMWTSGYED